MASLAGDLEKDDSVPPLHSSHSTPAFINNSYTDSAAFLTPRLSLDTDKQPGLEVIRHKVKVKKKKEKKAAKTDSDSMSSVDTDRVSVSSSRTSPHVLNTQLLSKVDASPLSPESGYKSVTENSSPKVNGHVTIICDSLVQRDGEDTGSLIKDTAANQNSLVIEACQTMPKQIYHDRSLRDKCTAVDESLVDGQTVLLKQFVHDLAEDVAKLSVQKPSSESSPIAAHAETEVVYSMTNSSQSQESGESSALHQNSNSCLSSCDSTNASPVPTNSKELSDDSEDAQTLYGSGIYSKTDNQTLCASGIYSDKTCSSEMNRTTADLEESSSSVLQKSFPSIQNSEEVGGGSVKQDRTHQWDLE